MARTFPLAAIVRTTLATGLILCSIPVGCAADKDGEPPAVVVNPNQMEPVPSEGGSSGAPPVPFDQAYLDLYEAPPGPKCGDGALDDGEACDDGANDNGDGCSGNCLVIEEGFECPEGTSCELAEICGDGRQVGEESCDDGNVVANDGCSANCQVEADFICPTPGSACETTVVCGDGRIAGVETCDDGPALLDGDGCSALCQLEEGFACPLPGLPCTATCGDGLIRGSEKCDDTNNSTPGCDANCQLEPGFFCPAVGAACEATVCGNGTQEGDEQCDDGNTIPYDGCSERCTNEPRCSFVGATYNCGAVCGDGMKFPEEECDDGNTTSGDGCSETCTEELESGFECVSLAADLGQAVDLPVVFRDFPASHPQFEIDPQNSPRLGGMVLNTLGPNGKPVYNPAFSFNGRPWTLDGAKPVANQNASLLTPEAIRDTFAQWYTSVPPLNRTFVQNLTLTGQPDGSFQFAASLPAQFFPLDGLVGTFGNENNVGGVFHNFHFTSEVRQWFLFDAATPPTLRFSGDDDVWVFVNGRLTVDLGGIHGELLGSIQINAGAGAGNALLCLQDTFLGASTCNNVTVPMSTSVNEIVVFQAERHVTQSNYTLTLRGFNAPVTTCESDCGNGIRTPDEVCDDGANNGAGYGFCLSTCLPGPRCGDGIANGPEDCDNGINRDGYQRDSDDCAPGCKTPSFCGDQVVDGRFGEACDDGVNDGAYNGCNPDCSLGPRCGDGTKNGDEECDDGNRRNTDGCNVNCETERQVVPT